MGAQHAMLAAFALVLAVAGAGQFEREPAEDLPFEVTFLGAAYCFDEGTTSFRYRVRTFESDLAHLVLGVGCDTETELGANPDDGWEHVIDERYTGLTGYRWLLGQESGTEREYELVLAGKIGAGDGGVPYGVTMHGRVGVGAAGGPSCAAPRDYPEFDGPPPGEEQVECGNELATTPENATDEVDVLESDCAAHLDITRTTYITGEDGLRSKRVSLLRVRDTHAPLMSHANETREHECGTGPVPGPATVVAFDECEGEEINATYCEKEAEESRCPNERLIVRTWTAVDECGNSACTTHTLRVTDTTPPKLHGVPDSDDEVECEGEGGFPGIDTVNVTATDSCGDEPCWADPGVPLTRTETRVEGRCGGDFAVERVWRAEDCCGNHEVKRQLVIVRDTRPPALEWASEEGGAQPANRTLTSCQGLPSQPVATARDECGNVSVPVVNLTEVVPLDGCPFRFDVHWHWTATDECTNAAGGVTVLTVDDPRRPQWGGEWADATNATVACDAVPPVPAVTLESPCGETSVSFTNWTDEEAGGDCPNEYDVWRVWEGTWGCGDEGLRLVQHLRVRDTKAPEFEPGSVPDHDTFQCLASVPDHAGGAATVVTEPEPCDSSAAVSWNETVRRPAQGGCPSRAVISRTWLAVDCSGNEATAEQTLTVNDTTAPMMVGLPDLASVTVHCHDVPGPNRVTAADTCDGPGVEVVVTDIGRPEGGCSYTFTRRYNATDLCGNSNVFDQEVVVEDGGSPEWLLPDQLPRDETLECGTPSQATLAAYDLCADSVAVEAWNATEPSSACDANYRVTYFWRAEDDCGNSVAHNQTVVTADTVPPVPGQNPPLCFLPVAHAPYHAVRNATVPGAFFEVSDACTAVSITVDSCASAQDSHFDGLVSGVPSAGFTEDCYYDAGDDTLYFRIRFDWREDDGRVFVVNGTAADECANTAPLQRSIWLPRDADSRVDGFDFGACAEVPIECGDECPCGYNDYECAASELDMSLTFHNVPDSGGGAAADATSTFHYLTGGAITPNRVVVGVDLTRVQVVSVEPDSGVQLGEQPDTYLSGISWRAGAGAGTGFSFTVSGSASATQPVLGQLLLGTGEGTVDAPCSHPFEVVGPGAVAHADGAAEVAGSVLVAGFTAGGSAAIPLAGAIVALSPGGGAPRHLTMTGADGRYRFVVPALGPDAAVSLEADGSLRRPSHGRTSARFLRAASGATDASPYGAPLAVPGAGAAYDFSLALDERADAVYQTASTGHSFKGRPRSPAWWSYNAGAAKSDAYGAASVPAPETVSACDAAAALLDDCLALTPQEMLSSAADDGLRDLAAAALNHASNRGVFEPYRDAERLIVLAARSALCRPEGERNASEVAASTFALSRLLEAY